MKINNINYTYNKSIDSNSQTTTQNVSFAEEMNKVTDSKVIETKGKILTFLEKINAFEGFTKEEEIKFKTILKDDKVTQKEFESIPYEMLDKFKTLVLPTNNSNFGEFQYVEMTNKSKLMLSTTALSGDKLFNQSVYETYGNMSEDDIVNMSLELSINLNQAYNQDDLKVFYIGILEKTNNISPDMMKQMTLDFQKVLLDMLNMSNDYIETVKDPQVLKQLYSTKNFYSSILDNYNELRSESSYV
ncbi:MAG: hypothetical protein ACNI25_03420 [Halarcobacter sp.]